MLEAVFVDDLEVTVPDQERVNVQLPAGPVPVESVTWGHVKSLY
jgi:hypothetical protein